MWFVLGVQSSATVSGVLDAMAAKEKVGEGGRREAGMAFSVAESELRKWRIGR
jgi:hypothetical protein